MHTFSFGVHLLLLLGAPIIGGLWLNRRLGLSWFLFFGGALAYAVGWIVTAFIPLRGEFGLLLSSVIQIGALYVIYRFQLKTADTERAALMVGVGQAGIELILAALVATLGFVFTTSLRNATDETIINYTAQTYNVTDEEIDQPEIERVRQTIDDFLDMPWYDAQSLQLLLLRNAPDYILTRLIAEADDVPEEEIEPAELDNLREKIDTFWDIPWYGSLINFLLYLPIQAALAVIVLGSLLHDHRLSLIGAMALHFLSRIAPLYAGALGGAVAWLGLSFIISAVTFWFLRRLWPVVQAQTEEAMAET